MTGWRLLIIFVGFFMHPSFADTPVARIAIIIDDLGYALAIGERALGLPGEVSFAVLPATPRGKDLAAKARTLGKDVLLHLPLQSSNAGYTAEPGGLILDMTRGQFAEAFSLALDSVPHAIGVNSHRGSLLTRHPGHMAWLMEEIRARQELFFVDSFTTHESVALDVAREAGVPAVKRDVFLDPDRQPETIEREFSRLKRLAHLRGFAVGIGHPYPGTLDLLEEELPKLGDEGIELISISRYVALRNGHGKSAHGTAEVE